MLALLSDGLTRPALLDALRAHATPGGRAALVVTADEAYKEKNYHVPRERAALEAMGLDVDIVDIDACPAAWLAEYAAADFIGGNPFYLLHALRRTGAEAPLRALARRGLLIGWSAAAFTFGRSLALVNRYSPEMNAVGLKDLRGLRLADVEVLPHYSRYINRFDRFEETCRDYERETGRAVIRLNDGAGVLVNADGTVTRIP